MAHNIYGLSVLKTRFKDQLESRLDLMQFCNVDRSLQGVPGDKILVRTYKATDDKTEVLAMGEGNTLSIEVDHEEKEYEIQLYQNRFVFYDEEYMKNPEQVAHGIDHQAVDMYNKMQRDVMAEFYKGTIKNYTNAFNFDAFVDGVAAFPKIEAVDNGGHNIFALCHKDNVAEIRKQLKDQLSYVEAYVRTGYIGTVNGVNLFVSNLATKDTIVLATKDAVTLKIKTGVEPEVAARGEDEANVRKNTMFLRAYGMPVFDDANWAVQIIKGTAPIENEGETGV